MCTEGRVRGLFLSFIFLLLTGCVSAPVFEETPDINLSLKPMDVRDTHEAHLGQRVIWGGHIVKTENLADSTRIEIMAYPLDSSQYPDRDEEALGRFMLIHKGFLEPLTYAEGRTLTVLGKIEEKHIGKVGQSDYAYPVVVEEQHKLWPEGGPPRTFFHFGIGISL